MKNLITILIVLVSGMLTAQVNEMNFSSKKQWVQHAFSNTNLSTFSSGYLLDLAPEWLMEDDLNLFLQTFGNNKTISTDNLYQILHLMERTDVNQSFIKDDFIKPYYDDFYKVSPRSHFDIPIVLFDLDMHRLKNNQKELIENWSGTDPFPMFTNNDAYTTNIKAVGPFIKTLVNPKIRFYWDDKSIISNTGNLVEEITLTINGHSFIIPKGVKIDINPLFSGILSEATVDVLFEDGTKFSNTVEFEIASTIENKGKSGSEWSYDFMGVIDASENSSEIEFQVKYGCGNDRLTRPFIMVAGWGPLTDNRFFNNLEIYKSKWPAEIHELYPSFNNSGLIDQLLAEGYDVVISKVYPPNNSVDHNSEAITKMIKKLNEIKIQNGSYEENIVLGYSAGGVSSRMALLKMEKRHLEQGEDHHHTKLYISFDGEHQGANMPLATQYMVKHLYDNSGLPNMGLYHYALNYILEAPLSQNLLYYYHTKTGDLAAGEQPSQGASDERLTMLQLFSNLNHSKNGHIPGYPSFTRNISIAQGSNTFHELNGGNVQDPYPYIEGFVPIQQTGQFKKLEAQFNKPGGNVVWHWKTKFPGANWVIKNEYKTNNQCLVIDNGPGGAMDVVDNPMDIVMICMKWAIAGPPDTYSRYIQYNFTPTLFCHDIRNFNPVQTNYRLDYDLAENNLFFQNSADEYSGLPSENYGYPHFGDPVNHYQTLTPFDAIFSTVHNEEHIFGNLVQRSNMQDFSEPYERVYNPLLNIMNKFILEESDYEDAFIQNEKYGHFIQNGNTYKAKVHAPERVFIGKKVTQRTNFKDAFFLENSEILVKAGKEIIIKEGANLLKGTNSHLVIGPHPCSGKSMKTSSSHIQNEEIEENYSDYESINYSITEEDNDWVKIYPNPSSGLVNFELKNITHVESEIEIYTIQGKLITQQPLTENSVKINLNKGVYIIKIRNHEKVYSQRLIVK